ILSAIIPDFVFKSGDQEISAPAQLLRHEDEFQFTLHFNSGRPPTELQSARGGFFNDADKKTIRGQINGEIGFRCDDVFPPSKMTTRIEEHPSPFSIPIGCTWLPKARMQ